MAKTGKRKRIFVSDIHLNDSASMKKQGQLKPWTWCSAKRSKMFADFLAGVSRQGDMAELVIAGDLFDGWLQPACVTPGGVEDRFASIAEAPENKEAITALKRMAADTGIRVSYLPGNHDMLLSKAQFQHFFPGAAWLGTSEGLGTFDAEGIHAEHGNRFSLFTSPDRLTVPGSILPLGYYNTRALAEALSCAGHAFSLTDFASQLLLELAQKEGMSGAFFRAFCANAHMDAESEVIMNDLDNRPGRLKVKAIEKQYSRLFEEWEKRWPGNTNVPAYLSAVSDTGHLLPAAMDRFFSQDLADIVILGHTHDYSLRSPWQLPFFTRKSSSRKTSVSHVYANCGTWIDEKQATFVETEVCAERGRHYVRLKAYSGPGKVRKIDELSVRCKS
jgi:UDP-2,3-diacylglucosamine pyrophosphatase LpxH